MYVPIQNTYQNTTPLPTAAKAGLLIQNKYILYVTLESCKYASGDYNIKIIFRYMKLNGSKHIIKYERR